MTGAETYQQGATSEVLDGIESLISMVVMYCLLE